MHKIDLSKLWKSQQIKYAQTIFEVTDFKPVS